MDKILKNEVETFFFFVKVVYYSSIMFMSPLLLVLQLLQRVYPIHPETA